MKTKLEKSVRAYSKENGYEIQTYSEMACQCGNALFRLFSDDEEGGAYAVCSKCSNELDICKSKEFANNSTQNICSCESEELKVCVGQALYEDSKDPRWTYVGGECPKCGVSGVYVDWQER